MRLTVFLAAVFCAGAAFAQDETPSADTAPIWELGVGGFAWIGPDYPVSGESNLRGLPFPLIIYRGDFLRIGEDAAARIVPIDVPLYEVGISVDGAFGADSDENDARDGMPDLDPMLQVGPEVVFHGPRFDLGEFGEGYVEFALQARAVFSIDTDDLRVESRGFVGQPLLRYTQRGLLGSKLKLGAEIGPVFATEKLHDYFYDVDSAFARAGRPAFAAEGGYLGTEIGFDLGYALNDRWNLFGGVDLSLHHGAANVDSPLFEDRLGVAAFFGATYAIWRSEKRVPRRD